VREREPESLPLAVQAAARQPAWPHRRWPVQRSVFPPAERLVRTAQRVDKRQPVPPQVPRRRHVPPGDEPQLRPPFVVPWRPVVAPREDGGRPPGPGGEDVGGHGGRVGEDPVLLGEAAGAYYYILYLVLDYIALYHIISCYVILLYKKKDEHRGEAAGAHEGVGAPGGVAATAGGEGGGVDAVHGMAEGSRARQTGDVSAARPPHVAGEVGVGEGGGAEAADVTDCEAVEAPAGDDGGHVAAAEAVVGIAWMESALGVDVEDPVVWVSRAVVVEELQSCLFVSGCIGVWGKDMLWRCRIDLVAVRLRPEVNYIYRTRCSSQPGFIESRQLLRDYSVEAKEG
jgi:hypothetical protein